MINRNIYKVSSEFKSLSREAKIILFYRYVSLILTSIFYCITSSNHSLDIKIFIVGCISISSIILTYLYMKNQDQNFKRKILILIEIMGNTMMLIPSGGLKSPYVWYSLNTILMTAVELDKRYCWVNLSIYLLASLLSDYFIFDRNTGNLSVLINEESNLILSLVLITALILLLLKYIKEIQNESTKLMDANIKLQAANKENKESMNYIMNLYHTVHIFSSLRDNESLIKLIMQYTKRITGTETVLFYILKAPEDVIIANTNIPKEFENTVKNKIQEQWNNIVHTVIPIEIDIVDSKFMFIPVKSSFKTYGILGVSIPGMTGRPDNKVNADRLKFISELSSIVLERCELEEVNERLLITGEQDRIANEIHDSVLQKLFYISCGIYTLMKKMDNKAQGEICHELNIMRNSIDSAMKELRSIIYDMSSKKNGVDTFKDDIMSYISEVKRLNNINITFRTTESHEFLSSWQKKALFRIICEGIGNSVRHGRAEYLEVMLDIQQDVCQLNITDNGYGFDVCEVKKSTQKGLGIRNLHYLTHLLGGKIDIKSIVGKGTEINVIFPYNTHVVRKGEVV